ncbi:hypothetical protein OAX78_00270 [Planctomycetota bacterium]|nr:hypothetical protein [Planctomycetota bacterium]
MKSHEVLRESIESVGAKKVAHDLKVSTSLVYKWCEDDEGEGSGARNPLDRIQGLIQTTGNERALEWLCSKNNGSFVRDPDVDPAEIDTEFLSSTQRLLEQFSKLLGTMSTSIQNDGSVDEKESKEIRQNWQRLKEYGEALVRACEGGHFDLGV